MATPFKIIDQYRVRKPKCMRLLPFFLLTIKRRGEGSRQLGSPSPSLLVVGALGISTAMKVFVFVASNAKECVSGSDSNGPEFPACCTKSIYFVSNLFRVTRYQRKSVANFHILSNFLKNEAKRPRVFSLWKLKHHKINECINCC
jgi:hypothetical protein